MIKIAAVTVLLSSVTCAVISGASYFDPVAHEKWAKPEVYALIASMETDDVLALDKVHLRDIAGSTERFYKMESESSHSVSVN